MLYVCVVFMLGDLFLWCVCLCYVCVVCVVFVCFEYCVFLC